MAPLPKQVYGARVSSEHRMRRAIGGDYISTHTFCEDGFEYILFWSSAKLRNQMCSALRCKSSSIRTETVRSARRSGACGVWW